MTSTFVSRYHHGKYPVKNKNDFYEEINRKLTCPDVRKGITECQNALCQNTEHRKASDEHMFDILCAMEEAAMENLTLSRRGNEKENTTRKAIPRWNEDIEPYRQDALFWHTV